MAGLDPAIHAFLSVARLAASFRSQQSTIVVEQPLPCRLAIPESLSRLNRITQSTFD
jgi:hypothetical protein